MISRPSQFACTIPSLWKAQCHPARTALRVVAWYCTLGFGWIILSDLGILLRHETTLIGFLTATFKGILFLLGSGAALFLYLTSVIRQMTQSFDMLRGILTGSTDAIFIKDEQLRYLLINPAGLAFLGRREDEVLGHTDQELFDPVSAELVAEGDRRVITSGEKQIVEDQTTMGGVFRIFQTSKVPYRNNQGKIIGLIGIAREVTDRRQAEAALRSERDRFERLVLASPTVIHTYRLRPDGTSEFPFVSPSVDKLLGMTTVDLIRLPEMTDPSEHDRVKALIDESQDQLTNFHAEFPIHHPTRGRIWLEVNSSPVKEDDGCIVWHGFLNDVTERKLAEQRLRDREEQLRIVTDAARVGLTVVDQDYRYRYANRAYAEILGFPVDGVIGRRIPDLLAEAWPQIQPNIDRALSGEPVTYEFQIPRRDHPGQIQWVNVVYEPIIRPDTGQRTLVAVVTDVSEIRQTTQALQASEERYRRLIEVLPTAVFVNQDDRITFCNTAFRTMVGAASTDEILGKSPLAFFHPDYTEIIRQRIHQMLTTLQPAPPNEEVIVRQDGRRVPVLVSATPIQENRHTSILVVIQDLSEQQRSAALLRSVVDSVTDAILTIDEHGRVHTMNPATTNITGYTPQELIGQNVKMLMPSPHNERHDDYLAAYLRTGEAKIIGRWRELEAQRKDGTTFPMELTVTEFAMEGRRHFTGVIRDISARKRLQDQLRQAQKMEAIGQLAGGVAHDFNNLLTVINGYSELMIADLPTDDPQREMLDAIRDAGERAARLTQQLLAFSRKTIVEPRLIDLNELIEQLGKMLRRLIGEDVTFVTILDPGIKPIMADPGQIEQVLMNLAVNARDAMPRGGRLTIETLPHTIRPGSIHADPELAPGEYVRLVVSDDGMGMSPEVVRKIFEPFFTTKGPGKGTGLGLATVYGIVKQAGGGIDVISHVGTGTSFLIDLPAVASHAIADHPSQEAPVPLGSEQILVVEDEDRVRELAALSLEIQGYTVHTARSGREAIEVLTAHPGEISLLLTDVVMPGMGGRDLADIARGRYPGMKVLFMSGYTDDAIVRHGIESATGAFLQKPFTPLALARKVRAILDGQPG